jgi:hypothetical protein
LRAIKAACPSRLGHLSQLEHNRDIFQIPRIPIEYQMGYGVIGKKS